MRYLSHALLSVVLFCTAASADVVRWTLDNAVFGDGTTAVGSFVYDTATAQVVSYSISVSEGSVMIFGIPYTAFEPFTYQNGASDNTGAYVDEGTFDGTTWNFIDFVTDLTLPSTSPLTQYYPDSGRRELRIPVGPLTMTGGTVVFQLSDPWQGECYNCAPSREFISGEVIGSVIATPEPVVVLPLLFLFVLVFSSFKVRSRAV